jgi:hypothetical protein
MRSDGRGAYDEVAGDDRAAVRPTADHGRRPSSAVKSGISYVTSRVLSTLDDWRRA